MMSRYLPILQPMQIFVQEVNKEINNKRKDNPLFEILDFIKKKQKNFFMDPRRISGEVFTPPELVEKILKWLDYYHKNFYKKSVFQISNYKWFEPSCGKGAFILCLYKSLMEGLKDEI